MAKPLKILMWIAASLLMLLVTAAIVLPMLFDPNDYRAQLSAAVNKQTGRSFAVGHIKLEVFPWLRVSLQDAVLGNAPGFGATPMLSVQEAEVGVKLWPLLTGQRVVADAVKLVGLRAALAIDAQGTTNWADLLQRQKERAEHAPKDSSNRRIPVLDIAAVELRDAALTYTDAQAAKSYTVEGLRLKSGRLHGTDAFPVEGAASLKATAPELAAQIEFASNMTWDAVTSTVKLSTLKAKLKAALAPAAPGVPLAVDAELATAALSYDGVARTITTAPLNITLAKLTRGAGGQPLLTAKGPMTATLALDLANKTYAAKALTADLELAGSSIPGGKPQAVKLAGDLAADLTANTATLQGITLAAFGVNASTSLKVENLTGEVPRASGPLSLSPFEPRKVLAALGIATPKTADPNSLKAAGLSTQLSASSKALSLSELNLKLDQTTLRGELAVTDYKPLSYSFKLNADVLDADRYLPPKREPPPGEALTEKLDVKSAELPVDMLQKLNAVGTLTVARLKLKGVALTDAVLRLSGAPKAVKHQQISANLYGGHAELAFEVSQAAKPGIAIKTVLTSISAGPLLKDFLGKDYVTGEGNVNLALTTTGRTVAEAKRGLNGTVNFALANGVVRGFNLGKIIREGQALLVPQTVAAAKDGSSTDFAELTGAGTFTNGVLRSDTLHAKNPYIRLEGAGELDFAAETINYLAKPTLVNTSSGQNGKELAAVSGIVIPLRLTGNLYKPKVSIDWQTAYQQKAADKLRSKLEGREVELKTKAADEISKGLLRLFGGKKAAPAQATSGPLSSDSPAQGQ